MMWLALGVGLSGGVVVILLTLYLATRSPAPWWTLGPALAYILGVLVVLAMGSE